MAKLQVWGVAIGHQGYNGVSVNAWCAGPNSAGGVSVKWSFKNLADKPIKYASFWFTPMNAVGDAVTCRITSKSKNGVRYTGPLAPGASNFNSLFENAWYNNSITSVRLDSVYIEYMDGSKEDIQPADILFSSEGVAGAGGCYVATAVYGSYDCPQVWTLRRYRDYTLAETWYGRVFIRTYYAISPTLVKWFGHTNWFKKLWKGKLDRMVKKLQDQGVESTPYDDREW
ncbi:MAG: hypothetical protein E7618_00980 [Ruminococcaceae bacterium]|nr:hypothetical protein [Oscillospiraceae bacterium]